jgi:cyclic beta-1,2-glucan synthetase
VAALEGRVPENALLSHDLFEGLYARAALVTDVEVVDDYPSSVLAHARQVIAGCAATRQILWWLFPFVPSRTVCGAIACRSCRAGRFPTTSAAA